MKETNILIVITTSFDLPFCAKAKVYNPMFQLINTTYSSKKNKLVIIIPLMLSLTLETLAE